MSRVFVAPAHPDDEVFGCDGAVVRHTDYGEQVHFLIVAERSTLRQPLRKPAQVRDKRSALALASQSVGSILGAEDIELLDILGNTLDSFVRFDLLGRIESGFHCDQPESIYFNPSLLMAISYQWQCRREALYAYLREMAEWLYISSPEVIEHLACRRRAQVRVEAVEGFSLLR